MGDSSPQSHSGANLNPKTVKDRGNVPKGGKVGGVALTLCQPEKVIGSLFLVSL